MRLIDADALIERAWRERLDTREQIAEMIDNAPIITDEEVVEEFVRQGVFKKAEPVKRGKRKVYYHGEATFSYSCGVCGMPIDHNDAYCRWCGSRMTE